MVWILSLVVAQQVSAINYFRCQETKQCVKAYGGCGRYLSVHQRYKELYEAKAHKSDRVANCLPPSDRDKLIKFEGQPQCLKDQCRLLIPEPEESI